MLLGLTARLPAYGAVSLALLPLAGMVLAWLRPPGLVDPPPITLDRVLPLVGRTVGLALVVAGSAAVLGTWLAWAQHRLAYPGRRVLALVALLPLAVPSYLLATITRESLAPAAWLGSLLGTEGAFSGFWPSALVLTIACVPYAHLIVGATLERIPLAEEEAARSLGASTAVRFRRLVVPRLRPAWALSMVIVTLYVVSDFGAVAVLDCEVLTWELYKAKGAKDAVVLAGGIVACVVPLLIGFRVLHGRGVPERPSGGPRPVDRRRASPAAMAAIVLVHLVVVGWGVAVPVVVLGGWVADGLRYGATFAPLAEPVWNTLLFTLSGATLTLLLAIAPAWLSARGGGRQGAWIEHGVHLTSSLPGVLVGFGVLHLVLGLKRHVPLGEDNAFWLALEGAAVFLLLAYGMRFLALAFDALAPVMLRLDPRQWEVARSLGASRWVRWRRVALPQLAPGLAAAWILVFLAVAKELPITLILTPLGRQTLAYRIFDAQQESSLPDVGLAGLTLMGLALGTTLVIRVLRGRSR